MPLNKISLIFPLYPRLFPKSTSSRSFGEKWGEIYLNLRSSGRSSRRSGFVAVTLAMFLEGTPRFRLWPDFIAHSILLTLRKYELLYLDVRSISLAHAVVSLFYLRIKKQSPEDGVRARARARAEYGFSSLLSRRHMIYAVYIAFIKFSRRRGTSTVLLIMRALIMNVLKITLSIAFPVRPPFPPSTFPSKTLAEIILRRRRSPSPPPPSLLRPPGYSRHLSSLRECFTLFHPVSRLMQSESVRLRVFLFFARPLSPLGQPLVESHSRGGGAEKLSPRFHPNVTDLTSRGDAARFPRIIILLSYNSFNSRESKTRGRVMPGRRPGSLPRICAGRCVRPALCVML